MIRTPPQHNTVNPPGQFYPQTLGDIIDRVQKQEQAERVPFGWYFYGYHDFNKWNLGWKFIVGPKIPLDYTVTGESFPLYK